MSDLLQPKSSLGFLNMPKLPFAGFWVRVLAFLIDFLLLLAGLYLVSRNFPGLFWRLGEWSPYASSAVAFLYFAGFNGPWGKGRTIGKTMLSIAVTDYDGNPPTFRQSVIRTVCLFPVFVAAPIVHAVFGEAQSVQGAFWRSMATMYSGASLLLALPLTVGFNPFKQGLHDFAAATLVRPTKEPAEPFEEVAGALGEGWRKYHRQPQFSGLVTWAMLTFALGTVVYPTKQPPEIERVRDFPREAAKEPGFERAEFALRFELADEFAKVEANVPSVAPQVSAAEDATTDTVRLVLMVSRVGGWPVGPDAPPISTSVAKVYDRYYRDVLNPIVGTWQDNADPRIQKLVEDWKGKKIAIRVLFLDRVEITPLLDMTRGVLDQLRIQWEWRGEYPPIEFKAKDDAGADGKAVGS